MTTTSSKPRGTFAVYVNHPTSPGYLRAAPHRATGNIASPWAADAKTFATADDARAEISRQAFVDDTSFRTGYLAAYVVGIY